MSKLMKNILLVGIGVVLTLSGGAIAEPLNDAKRACGLAGLTNAYSLFNQVAGRVVAASHYVQKPVTGRNKYGFPVPDTVKTAREGKRRSDFLHNL
jgi:hypothetical protein